MMSHYDIFYLFGSLLLPGCRAAVSNAQGQFRALAELWQGSALHISQHAVLIEL